MIRRRAWPVPRGVVQGLLLHTLGWWLAVRAFLYFFWNHTLFDEFPYSVAVTCVVAIAMRTGLRLDRQELFLASLGLDLRKVIAVVATLVLVVEIVVFVAFQFAGADA